jgi:hypothetical protein
MEGFMKIVSDLNITVLLTYPLNEPTIFFKILGGPSMGLSRIKGFIFLRVFIIVNTRVISHYSHFSGAAHCFVTFNIRILINMLVTFLMWYTLMFLII